MTRVELVEAAVQASAQFWGDRVPDDMDMRAAEAVLDAVEPLIRADERGAMGMREIAAEIRTLTELRAKVSSMPVVDRESVLALLDGSD